MNEPLRCSCGHEIAQDELLRQEYYLRPFGPHVVYLKFRCSACLQITEKFVPQNDWHAGCVRASQILNAPEINEPSVNERRRFAELGPITRGETADAQIDLHTRDALALLRSYFSSDRNK